MARARGGIARSSAPRVLAAVITLSCTPLHGGPAEPESAAATSPREYVGEYLCRSCHAKEAEHWNDTVHDEVGHGAAAGEPGARACATCHGPGSEHVASGGDPEKIVAFTRGSVATVEQQNEVCLGCHAAGGRVHWRGSA